MKFKLTRSQVAAPASHFQRHAGSTGIATLAIATALSFAAATARAADAAKATTPNATQAAAAATTDKAAAADKPVWIIVEEDFWVPLQYSPWESIEAVQIHYRNKKEKAAAAEIRKAVSWLNLAAGHALPKTQKHLQQAAAELTTVGKDLAAGTVLAANALDAPLARASHALAEWHYYRAQETWGGAEAQNAGNDLVMAAHYLRQAADSAHYEFGKDTDTAVTSIWENGKLISNNKETTHNWVATDLEGVEKALRELGKTLEK